MADKDLTIGIKTTGAEAAAKAIRQVDAAAEDLGQTAAKDTARGMENMTDKARVAEFAFYDLDANLRATATGTTTLTAGMTKLAPSTRDNARALLMFSQGFEDAQYGIRGVLNNIPGLVLALGGGAGLAGAISIAAVSFSVLYEWLGKTEEKASDVAASIDKISDNMGDMEIDRFNAAVDAIDNARERTEALKQEWDDTRAAEQQFATSALDNAGKLAEAQRNVASALGSQVDSYKELQAIAAQESEKRRLAAEQAIASEQDRLAAQQSAVTSAADYLAEKRNIAAIEEANLVSQRAQLETLREQKAELEKIAQQRTTSDDPGRQLIGAIFPKTLPLTDEAKDARKQLEDPVFKEKLEGVEDKVDKLAAAVESLTKDGGIVTRAENAFLAAQTQLTDLTQAVSANIQRIEGTLAADDLLARSQNLAATQEQQAKQLSAALANIQTTTEAGRTATASIQAVVADGRVTANESEQLAQASVAIIGQIQAGLATAGSNTQEILGVLRAVAARELANKRELAELRRLVEENLR